jgi:hypothetical protein
LTYLDINGQKFRRAKLTTLLKAHQSRAQKEVAWTSTFPHLHKQSRKRECTNELLALIYLLDPRTFETYQGN